MHEKKFRSKNGGLIEQKGNGEPCGKTTARMEMHGIISLTIMREAGYIAGAKMALAVSQTMGSNCVFLLLYGTVKMRF